MVNYADNFEKEILIIISLSIGSEESVLSSQSMWKTTIESTGFSF